MQPESFAAIEATIAAHPGDEAWAKKAKVNVLLGQANKLHTLRVMLFSEPGHRYNPLDQFSMVLALVLGTAGLPHILNRYYTNPSGKAARRSTFWVLIFIGTFYIFAPIAGLAGRQFISAAAADGTYTGTAALVDGFLVKSDQVMPAIGQLLGGDWLMGIVAAGAFAAMFSTIGGLLIAAASAIGHDVYEKYINTDASEAKRVAVAKISVVSFALIALALGLAIPASGLDKAYPALIAMMVTWAFAVGGSAFVPMLLTGIWWKKTTEAGAIAGMFVGLAGSIFFIFLNILQQLKVIPTTGVLGFLGSLTFPTIFIFPLAAGHDRHREPDRREASRTTSTRSGCVSTAPPPSATSATWKLPPQRATPSDPKRDSSENRHARALGHSAGGSCYVCARLCVRAAPDGAPQGVERADEQREQKRRRNQRPRVPPERRATVHPHPYSRQIAQGSERIGAGEPLGTADDDHVAPVRRSHHRARLGVCSGGRPRS